jgi:hypothetical protein
VVYSRSFFVKNEFTWRGQTGATDHSSTGSQGSNQVPPCVQICSWLKRSDKAQKGVAISIKDVEWGERLAWSWPRLKPGSTLPFAAPRVHTSEVQGEHALALRGGPGDLGQPWTSAPC